MSFIGTVGVVAQQGNQGAAGPTDVSIATAETGGTNNAFTSVEQTGLFHGVGYPPNSTPVFNATFGNVHDINLDHVENGYEDDGLGHPGYITGFIYGYIRATGATTFAWTCSVNNEETSLSNSITASITGSSSDTQDGTSRDGTGFMWRLTLPSSGSFPNVTYAIPSDNDVFAFNLQGIASDNSGNDVTSQLVTGNYRFIAP